MALTKTHNRLIAGSETNVIDFGAVGDGVTDDLNAFNLALAHAIANNNVLVINPGTYHLSSDFSISSANGLKISGYGATLDNSVSLYSMQVYIEGLTVDGSPSYGFGFNKAQFCKFTDLIAINCTSHGYQLGIDGSGQVARGKWINCHAGANGGNGFHLDEDATDYINDNDFYSCDAKSNQWGFYLKGTTNGNSFFGGLSESNVVGAFKADSNVRRYSVTGGYYVGDFIDSSSGQGTVIGTHQGTSSLVGSNVAFAANQNTSTNLFEFVQLGNQQRLINKLDVTGTVSGTTGHTVEFDSFADGGDRARQTYFVEIYSDGASTISARSFFFSMTVLVVRDSVGAVSLKFDTVSTNACSINSVTRNSSTGVVTIDFNTTSSITASFGSRSYTLT